MNDLRITTIRAIHDALAIRGLVPGDGGVIRTASPELYMSEERLRLAREVLRHIPAGATATGLDELASKIEPVVARFAKPKPEAEPRGIMFIS